MPGKIRTYFRSLQFGFLSYASFFMCILSGIALAYVYKPESPADSISMLFIINKTGLFLRSVHYWSTQFFLITSVLHIIDHQVKRTERDQTATGWLNLVLLIPVIFFAAFSGFLLKGDYESTQALAIFRGILYSIPLFGNEIALVLTGKTDSNSVVLFHHIFSSTIIIWILTIFHSKRYFTNAKTFLQTAIPVFILSLIFIPGLTGESELARGPWYFAGLQEMLHYISSPLFVVSLFVLMAGCLYWLKFLSEKHSKFLKYVLLFITFFYILLSADFIFFRSQNWKFGFSTESFNSYINFYGSGEYLSADTLVKPEDIPMINGKLESCMVCHKEMKGLSKSHDISVVGCYSCHLGNPLSLNKTTSHSGMTLTPANLSIISKTCGKAGCHSDIHARINNSIMNTMSGVVTVDKFTFNEMNSPDGHFNIANIGFSPADKHLRELCASCHFGNEKSIPGEVSELTRGGGCSACHLEYRGASSNDLTERNKNKNFKSSNHPLINLNVQDKNCFGCHSRSGRISTNYEGWHETSLPESDYPKLSKLNYRLLEDGRIFVKKTDDVHHRAGMQCIDCHPAQEIMGDGKLYSHKEQAVKISCEDCHTNKPMSVRIAEMDAESKKILKLRGLSDTNSLFLQAVRSGLPYLNAYVENGKIIIKPKYSDKELIAHQPSGSCGRDIAGHSRLDCKSCHTSWAPQCISCHTQFDKTKQGWDYLTNKNTNYSWVETPGQYLAEYPALGVIKTGYEDKITTFVPGMVLTISNGRDRIFRRLFAPAFSHTINKNATTCKTCHLNPVVLGIGRGKLSFSVQDHLNSGSVWNFIPQYLNVKDDGLPQDAWTSFLVNSSSGKATRPEARPLNADEQKKILKVGQCFNCHKENDTRMMKAFSKKNYLDFISKKCKVFIVK